MPRPRGNRSSAPPSKQGARPKRPTPPAAPAAASDPLQTARAVLERILSHPMYRVKVPQSELALFAVADVSYGPDGALVARFRLNVNVRNPDDEVFHSVALSVLKALARSRPSLVAKGIKYSIDAVSG